jgi:hypothetical protein
MQIILDLIQQHPEAIDLLKTSLTHGSITVTFNKETAIGSRAAWDIANRIIIIRNAVTEPYYLLDAFIFELSNSIYMLNRSFSLLTCTSAEEYALKTESLEYKTNQKTASIMNDGVERYHWTAPKNGITRPFFTLEEYLEKVKINHPRFNGFSHFDLIKMNYCKHKIANIKKTNTPTGKKECEHLIAEMKAMTHNAEICKKPKTLLLGYDACRIVTVCTLTALTGVTLWASMQR